MKYYGIVGYRNTSEVRQGVWDSMEIVERPYYGDILKLGRRYQSSDKTNDDIEVENQISIISDPFALNNFHNIVYISWMGTNWKVSKVDVEFPRLLLTLGGVYNGPTA